MWLHLFTCGIWCWVLFLLSTATLLNVHEKTRSRPSTWMVAAFYPVSGAESTWDARGGNSKAVRGVELMMECNDCLYEGWNEQTKTTHCERWADKLEVETHIVRIGHIQDKPEGDKMLGDPGVCHHCFCPASHFPRPSSSFPPKQEELLNRRFPWLTTLNVTV